MLGSSIHTGQVYLATQTVKPGSGENGGDTIRRAVKMLRNSATTADKVWGGGMFGFSFFLFVGLCIFVYFWLVGWLFVCSVFFVWRFTKKNLKKPVPRPAD
jgi:hypothetical protein